MGNVSYLGGVLEIGQRQMAGREEALIGANGHQWQSEHDRPSGQFIDRQRCRSICLARNTNARASATCRLDHSGPFALWSFVRRFGAKTFYPLIRWTHHSSSAAILLGPFLNSPFPNSVYTLSLQPHFCLSVIRWVPSNPFHPPPF
jgi:hypothetical protein